MGTVLNLCHQCAPEKGIWIVSAGISNYFLLKTYSIPFSSSALNQFLQCAKVILSLTLIACVCCRIVKTQVLNVCNVGCEFLKKFENRNCSRNCF